MEQSLEFLAAVAARQERDAQILEPSLEPDGRCRKGSELCESHETLVERTLEHRRLQELKDTEERKRWGGK